MVCKNTARLRFVMQFLVRLAKIQLAPETSRLQKSFIQILHVIRASSGPLAAKLQDAISSCSRDMLLNADEQLQLSASVPEVAIRWIRCMRSMVGADDDTLEHVLPPPREGHTPITGNTSKLLLFFAGVGRNPETNALLWCIVFQTKKCSFRS